MRGKELGQRSLASLQVGRLAGFEQGVRPTPGFFVSVASKGVKFSVSLLFATVAGVFISVADKGLMGARCWREDNASGCRNLGEI